MDRFVSHYTLRLDTKGRVSIPAPFRAVLARDGFEGLYCYPTLDRPALDAGGNALLKEIDTLIARFPPYSEEREQFSAALYGTSEVLKIDGEGRAILTEPLKRHAGIKDEVAFAGLGHKFQIWEPGRFRAELAEATEKVRALTKQLGSRVAAEGRVDIDAAGADWLVTFPCSAAPRSNSSRSAPAASMSTRPSVPAATPAISSRRRTATSSASTVTKARSRAAPTSCARPAAGSSWWRTNSPIWKRSRAAAATTRSTASSSTSVSPRCSSTRRRADFPSAMMVRSTCAWAATGRPRPMSWRRHPSASLRPFSRRWAKSVTRAALLALSSPHAGKRRSAPRARSPTSSLASCMRARARFIRRPGRSRRCASSSTRSWPSSPPAWPPPNARSNRAAGWWS